MGKQTLYKGVLRGTATSAWNTMYTTNFSFKLDEKIEGIPEEIVVYSTKMTSATGGFGLMGKIKKIAAMNIRPGDRVIVEGEIIVEYEGSENVEYFRMGADHIYNETLKVGF